MCTSVNMCLCFSLSALCVCVHGEACQGQIIAEHMWSEEESKRGKERKGQGRKGNERKGNERTGREKMRDKKRKGN